METEGDTPPPNGRWTWKASAPAESDDRSDRALIAALLLRDNLDVPPRSALVIVVASAIMAEIILSDGVDADDSIGGCDRFGREEVKQIIRTSCCDTTLAVLI